MSRTPNEGVAPDFSNGSVAVELFLRQEPVEDEEDDEDEGDDKEEDDEDDDDDEGTDDGYSE